MAIEINVGLLVAGAPAADKEQLRAFSDRLVSDITPELEDATGARWIFDPGELVQLSTDDPHRPSDFLDEAALRMAEGPFDLVIVITDVPLVSRRREVVSGLASPVTRMAVISTRKLLVTPRGREERSLADEAVRWNGATLLLHQIGHLLRLPHVDDPRDAMQPFELDEQRQELLPFGARSRSRLKRHAEQVPEPAYRKGSRLGALLFHLRSAARHPGLIVRPVLRNRALLLALSLPSLATAAIVPALLLVFTAEIWDVGLNLRNDVSWLCAVAAIVGATWYLLSVQQLFFPHEERRVIPERLAIVNLVIFCTMLLAMLGLFLMINALMLVIEIFVFPQGLIATWPTLQDPKVTLGDKFRLASFISTVGVLSGALGGGLESRDVIRHLALFATRP